MTPHQHKLLLAIVSGLCLFTLSKAQTANYCDASLCSGKQHIACKNSGSFASICAANAKIIPISTNLQVAIVNKHNNLRNKIAQGGFSGYKPALRMASMRWNSELAKLAEYNVKQCVMSHDQCRSTTKFKYAGQNLAYSKWSGKTMTVKAMAMSHVQMWFKEYKDCTMAEINSYKSNGKMIGHFTSMMQEKSGAVGCAILRQSKNGSIWQFIACNYAYTNILGKPVYRKGVAVSGCTTGRHPVYTSLCSLNEIYSVNDPNIN